MAERWRPNAAVQAAMQLERRFIIARNALYDAEEWLDVAQSTAEDEKAQKSLQRALGRVRKAIEEINA